MSALESEAPDMLALQQAGVSQADAIAKCEAWKKAHDLREAHLVKATPIEAPKQPPAAKPAAEHLDPDSARSMLHALTQEIERPNQMACLSTLVASEWSLSFARELKRVIDASKQDSRL